MADRVTIVESPNATRPTGLTLEIADMLRRIEYNYGREGSGPGSRFEGQLLEDVQARAVLRCVRELATEHRAVYFTGNSKDGIEALPFARMLGEDQP